MCVCVCVFVCGQLLSAGAIYGCTGLQKSIQHNGKDTIEALSCVCVATASACSIRIQYSMHV